jgi:2-hydroxychromene-2-carboxylate isomerase
MDTYRQQQESEEEYLAMILRALHKVMEVCTDEELFVICHAAGIDYREVKNAPER